MQISVKERLVFLEQLETKKRPCKTNKSNKEYIDRFISNNYHNIMLNIRRFSDIISNAMDMTDRLNNVFLELYYDHSVKFRSQMECDDYVLSILKREKLFW